MKTQWKVLLCIVASIVLLTLYWVDPSDHLWIPKCPTKLLFGIDCPGCGCQRAIHAFMHGNIKDAFNYNPFIVFALPYALTAVGYKYIKNKHIRNRIGAVVESKFMTYTYIITFSLWFIIRNLN